MDNKLTRRGVSQRAARVLLYALICMQPLLDVAAYFLRRSGDSMPITLLRGALLVAVFITAFISSDNKRAYFICAALVGLFFAAHAGVHFALGYRSLSGDIADYARVAQLPLYTIAFITLLRRAGEPFELLARAFTVNLGTIVLVIALSYALGMPEYTYGDYGIDIGVMGWFAAKNAQSSILVIMSPLILCWLYGKKNPLWFYLGATLDLGLLFFTGSRLCYYGLLLYCVGFCVVMLLTHRFVWQRCAFIVLVMLAAVGCYRYSPMTQRMNTMYAAFDVAQQRVDDLSESSWDLEYTINSQRYEVIYGDIYENMTGAMCDEFGTESVAQAYGWLTDSNSISDVRAQKQTYARLRFAEMPLSVRLFGMEQADFTLGSYNYDFETDYSGIFYSYGYIGIMLFAAFILYFIVRALAALWRHSEYFMTPTALCDCMALCVMLAAAEFSGHIFRRPNVTIYFALLLAALWLFCGDAATLDSGGRWQLLPLFPNGKRKNRK